MNLESPFTSQLSFQICWLVARIGTASCRHWSIPGEVCFAPRLDWTVLNCCFL